MDAPDPQADDVGDVGGRNEPARTRTTVAREHQEHVADQRERQRIATGADADIAHVEVAAPQHQHGQRLGDVLDDLAPALPPPSRPRRRRAGHRQQEDGGAVTLSLVADPYAPPGAPADAGQPPGQPHPVHRHHAGDRRRHRVPGRHPGAVGLAGHGVASSAIGALGRRRRREPSLTRGEAARGRRAR